METVKQVDNLSDIRQLHQVWSVPHFTPRKTWTQCPATAISLKPITTFGGGKNGMWRYPTACVYSEIIPFAQHNQYTSLWTAFVQFFALGRKQLSVTVDRDVCQFSRERHIAVEFFQMSFLDPLSISNKFPVTFIASGWQLKGWRQLSSNQIKLNCATLFVSLVNWPFKIV